MIKDLFLVIISTALVNNILLSRSIGTGVFTKLATDRKTAAGMGCAVAAVLAVSSAISAVVYNLVLSRLNLEYLKTIIFVIVILIVSAIIAVIIKKAAAAFYEKAGKYIYLTVTNCAVLGTALVSVQNNFNVLTSVAAAIGTAVGFAVVVAVFADVRERTQYNDFPESFKGTPAVLLTAGLMAIAFYGFTVFA